MSKSELLGKESMRLIEQGGIQFHGYNETEEEISLIIKDRDIYEMYLDVLNESERNLWKMISDKEKEIKVHEFFDKTLSKLLKDLGYTLKKDDQKENDQKDSGRPKFPKFVISKADLEKIHSKKESE